MYTPSDTRLGWPGEGPLFESDSKYTPGPLLKSCLRPLARYGTHQETMSGTCLGRGHFSSWILINGGGGQNVGTIQVTPGPLLTSGLDPWPDMALL